MTFCLHTILKCYLFLWVKYNNIKYVDLSYLWSNEIETYLLKVEIKKYILIQIIALDITDLHSPAMADSFVGGSGARINVIPAAAGRSMAMSVYRIENKVHRTVKNKQRRLKAEVRERNKEV